MPNLILTPYLCPKDSGKLMIAESGNKVYCMTCNFKANIRDYLDQLFQKSPK